MSHNDDIALELLKASFMEHFNFEKSLYGYLTPEHPKAKFYQAATEKIRLEMIAMEQKINKRNSKKK